MAAFCREWKCGGRMMKRDGVTACVLSHQHFDAMNPDAPRAMCAAEAIDVLERTRNDAQRMFERAIYSANTGAPTNATHWSLVSAVMARRIEALDIAIDAVRKSDRP